MANNSFMISHHFSPLTLDFYARALQNFSSPATLTPMTNNANHKIEIGLTYVGVNPTSMLYQRNQPPMGRAENNNFFANEIDDNDDGRIHSVPYIKNGPYTCSKCKKQFVTSQRFAAHVVSDHYKYETREQKRNRLMKRVQRRNLTLQMVSGGLTLVPISSQLAGTANVATGASGMARVAYEGGGGIAMQVKVEGGLQSHYQFAYPGMVAPTVGFAGVRIKSEPYA